MRTAKTLAVLLSLTLATAPVMAKGQNDDRGGPPEHAHGHKDKGNKHADKGGHRGARGWSKGDVVPQAYRGASYVVSDWRAVKLKAPPPGHRWIKVDGDYVLVAIATGVIASILLGD